MIKELSISAYNILITLEKVAKERYEQAKESNQPKYLTDKLYEQYLELAHSLNSFE